MPSQATLVEPLRPAWPSWMPNFAAELACTKSTMRFQPAACRSFHRPRQPGVMRASGETQVISPNTRAAPPMARAPRWTRWKSFGSPSAAEYIAIGETTMRLGSVTPRTI